MCFVNIYEFYRI